MLEHAIEQIAVPVKDIDKAIEFYGHPGWIRDTVRAHIIYGRDDRCTDIFSVSLAFNYSVIRGVEFELIQFDSGHPIQYISDVVPKGHLGYHVGARQSICGTVVSSVHPFVEEVQSWVQGPYSLGMIARTFSHTGFQDRNYLYALVDTRDACGMWTKIISRIPTGLKLTEEEVRGWIS